MLARRIGAPFVAALIGIATVALQEKLGVFAATQAANRSGILRHRYFTFLVLSLS
jgi:hypothetical protein